MTAHATLEPPTDAPPARTEWERAGLDLGRTNSTKSWALGDWLRTGTRTWGDAYTAAEQITGIPEKNLRNVAYVAGKFSLSRRRDKLTFGHHAEVAALPPAEADELLDRAEREGLSLRQLRGIVPRRQQPATIEPVTEQLKGALRDLRSTRGAIGHLLSPTARAELDNVIAEIDERLTGATPAGAYVCDDDRATDEDLAMGRYGRRV